MDILVAQRTGIGLRYERQINTRFFVATLLLLNRTGNDSPGSVLDGETAPYQPGQVACLTFNYLSRRGNTLKLNLNYQSSFFQDDPLAPSPARRPRFPGGITADLRLAREPTVGREFFVEVNNFSTAVKSPSTTFRPDSAAWPSA